MFCPPCAHRRTIHPPRPGAARLTTGHHVGPHRFLRPVVRAVPPSEPGAGRNRRRPGAPGAAGQCGGRFAPSQGHPGKPLHRRIRPRRPGPGRIGLARSTTVGDSPARPAVMSAPCPALLRAGPPRLLACRLCAAVHVSSWASAGAVNSSRSRTVMPGRAASCSAASGRARGGGFQWAYVVCACGQGRVGVCARVKRGRRGHGGRGRRSGLGGAG